MPGLLPHQILKFTGGQSTSFLSSLVNDPPLNWSVVSCLDLSEVSFITPVVAGFSGIAKSLGWDIIYPTKYDAKTYLNYMLDAEDYRSCERYMPITQCSRQLDVAAYGSKIRNVIEGWVSSAIADAIYYSLTETMDNVFDHAQSDKGLWMHIQKYTAINYIEIVLIDMGRGISKSLSDNPDFSHLSDEDKFNHALELGVSSNPSCHAGEGLSSTLEWLKLNQDGGARGLVISHEFLWFLGKSRYGTIDQGRVCWPGTFIWFKIPLFPPTSLTDAWEIMGLGTD